MKKKKVIKKLDSHYHQKKFVVLTRKKGSFQELSKGFIIDKSSKLLLLLASEDFEELSYQIIPIDTIIHVRYNKNDKTYESILRAEGIIKNLKPKYNIDLSSWKSATKDVKKTGLTVISECEHPKLDFFCIGEIKKINKKSLSIRYFNAQGILDKHNTKHLFKDITKLSFDDHYANIFSKYVKKQ